MCGQALIIHLDTRLNYHARMSSLAAESERIHSLPSVLASQIAAGEIIERPASVVKELVENSLDAGAGKIQIDIEAAGSRLIRVRDDGQGIHPQDLRLALMPHSTSKIRRLDDLAAITSLGFRGEALASIAAVARLRICSCRAGQTAHEIEAAPGEPLAEPVPASHPAGTTIEVRNLFFSMPARRKFMRTEQTEFLHIQELVKCLSLSQPGLGIRLTHNGRTVFNVSAAAATIDRVRQIFGRTFPEAACLVDETDNSLHLQGIAGLAESARSQADRQYLFLNGRLIRDRRLSHALRTAYQESLPAGRYAPFLLYLAMDPHEFDINVHPTKHEVRFRAGRDVHDFVYSALRRSLEAGRPIAEWQGTTVTEQGGQFQQASVVSETPAATYQAGKGNPTGLSAGAVTGDFGEWLGCVSDRYLLLTRADAVTVIDCRAAVSRLTRMALERSPDHRPLLLPETLTVNSGQAAAVERWQGTLAEIGVELEPTSPTRVMLRTLPSAMPAVDAATLLPALLESLGDLGRQADTRDTLLSLLAAHSGNAFSPAADSSYCQHLPQRLYEAMMTHELTPPWPWKTLTADELAAWFELHD